MRNTAVWFMGNENRQRKFYLYEMSKLKKMISILIDPPMQSYYISLKKIQ